MVAEPVDSCATLDKLPRVSELQFPHQPMCHMMLCTASRVAMRTLGSIPPEVLSPRSSQTPWFPLVLSSP